MVRGLVGETQCGQKRKAEVIKAVEDVERLTERKSEGVERSFPKPAQNVDQAVGS